MSILSSTISIVFISPQQPAQNKQPPLFRFPSSLPPPLPSHFPPSSSSSTTLLRARTRRHESASWCPRVLLSSFNLNDSMAELVNDEETLASSTERKENEIHPSSLLDAKTEEELLSAIKKEEEAGKLPSIVAAGMEELYHNYKKAVLQSRIPNAAEIILSNMAVALDRVFSDVKDPFVFSPYHKALREPFDYYRFGQDYIRPLVDFGNSFLGNAPIFSEVEEKLNEGHNVVLISNHQAEADPAIIALLLEASNPYLAENLIYVAGDRVITDPLSKPFSMGRNLICVYSKKHIFDVPKLAEMKKKANIRSLKEMAMLLREGSKIVWIAPSGGRDRPDPSTGEWCPAPFDVSSVDNMRRLVDHSGAPGHIYPLALLCHDIMPPPPQVEKEIGEKRLLSFSGVGLSIAPEIQYSEIAAACGSPEEAKDAYSQALYNSVLEQYKILKSAIHGMQGMDATSPTVLLSQPWN